MLYTVRIFGLHKATDNTYKIEFIRIFSFLYFKWLTLKLFKNFDILVSFLKVTAYNSVFTINSLLWLIEAYWHWTKGKYEDLSKLKSVFDLFLLKVFSVFFISRFSFWGWQWDWNCGVTRHHGTDFLLYSCFLNSTWRTL